jgi:excinuclease UvrABC nuclease subunit
MKMDNCNLNKLLDAGFVPKSTWRRGEDGFHSILPKEPGLYAFVVGGMIMYVGSANESLRRRMGDYRRGLRQAAKKRRVYREIANVLRGDGKIELFTLESRLLEQREWNNLPVDMLIGLEAGLIKEFDPEWNHRGRKRKTSVKSV